MCFIEPAQSLAFLNLDSGSHKNCYTKILVICIAKYKKMVHKQRTVILNSTLRYLDNKTWRINGYRQKTSLGIESFREKTNEPTTPLEELEN